MSFITENFGLFLKLVRVLKIEDQELLLAYYCLGASQTSLASIFKVTQTLCSTRLRAAIKTLCSFILFGEVTPAKMKIVLEREGWEHALTTPLSQLVAEYVECRSFQHLSITHGIHRPAIRRAMNRASRQLIGSVQPDAQALGAYLFSLTDKVNPIGTGFSKKKIATLGDVRRCDPDLLGQFRVQVTDRNFGVVFQSRANR